MATHRDNEMIIFGADHDTFLNQLAIDLKKSGMTIHRNQTPDLQKLPLFLSKKLSSQTFFILDLMYLHQTLDKDCQVFLSQFESYPFVFIYLSEESDMIFLHYSAQISELQSIDRYMSLEDVLHAMNDKRYQTENTRKSMRILQELDIAYHFGNHQYFGKTYNISVGGAFIKTLNPLPDNAEIDIELFLPDDKNTALKIKGKVLYNITFDADKNILVHPKLPGQKIPSHPGLAISFEKIHADDLKILTRFISEDE